MKFIDFIEEECIMLDVPFISKKRLFEFLAQQLCQDEKEKFAIYQSFVDREKMGNTALNNGVAIPHGKCLEDSDDIRVVIARLAQKADYEALDDVPVQVVMAMAFPIVIKPIHKQIMNEAAQLFKQYRMFKGILAADGRKEVSNVILETYQQCNNLSS